MAGEGLPDDALVRARTGKLRAVISEVNGGAEKAHELEEPLLVPAGTQIIATGAFDNSSQNAYNPDANSEVNWGEQSWEEMFMGFYSWKNVDQGGSE